MTNTTDRRARQKRWDYLRQVGRPSLVTGTPEVEDTRQMINDLHAKGMSYRAIGAQVGVPASTVSTFAGGRAGILRTTLTRLQQVQHEARPDDGAAGARVDPTGTQRRLQALWAAGFPIGYIRQAMGPDTNEPYLRRILHGRSARTHAAYARRVADVYQQLAGTNPADLGATQHGITYARNAAARAGYAPPHCWDPETIDNPDATPEWTGECGTETGYRIHRREGTEPCPACRTGRNEERRSERADAAEQRRAHVAQLLAEGRLTAAQIAEETGVSERTVQRTRRAA
ncbi:helix-turn-helix domain-containing protein [Streptomyces sp. 796.1]|uniref:helix-turn-helix domain-containing protein n=1 Tax=Streptomyces sp. 796.1 TaxID=3163029 RepID=UPI0039C8E427